MRFGIRNTKIMLFMIYWFVAKWEKGGPYTFGGAGAESIHGVTFKRVP
jgi:hypothetical protein